MSDSKSVTWTAHLRIIFIMYNLPDPLILLENCLWPKERWKQHTKIAVTAYHEANWRHKAANNFTLQYLNVQITGLSGRTHPIFSWVLTILGLMIGYTRKSGLRPDFVLFNLQIWNFVS